MTNENKQGASYGVGRLVLHRFCGEEEFVLSAAEMLAYWEEGAVRLWFDAETEGECVKRLEDTASLHAVPNVSMVIDLPALIPNQLVGQRFTPTRRDPSDDPPGTIYYVEHDELRDCSVEVMGREGKVFLVTLRGSTTDVNYYDGSKPDTRLEVEGRFIFAEVGKWEA